MDFMNNWAAEDLAEAWDNVGFQIGKKDTEVSGVVLALDLDERVYEFARENNCNMIITHHPFIFSGLKSITDATYDGRLIMKLIKGDFVFYAAHTNLDQALGGVNEQLASLFNLKDSKVLEKTDENDEKIGYGKIGLIDEIRLEDFIDLVKEKLDLEHLTVFGNTNKPIEKLALMGGSGSSFIEKTKAEGADLFLTGDVKYHDGQLAEKLGLVLIDAGHFHTEKVVLGEIYKRLKSLDENLKIKIYKEPSPIYKIY